MPNPSLNLEQQETSILKTHSRLVCGRGGTILDAQIVHFV